MPMTLAHPIPSHLFIRLFVPRLLIPLLQVLSMSIPDLRTIAELLAEIDRLDGHPATSARGVARRRSSAGSVEAEGYVCPLHREGDIYDAETAQQQTGVFAERELSQVAASSAAASASSSAGSRVKRVNGAGGSKKRQLGKVAESSDEEDEEQDLEASRKKARVVKPVSAGKAAPRKK
jgi:hypothetical protein